MTIQTIGIVGSGQMGAGIAQVAATAGYSAILVDTDASQLDRGLSGIRASLLKLQSKGKIEAETVHRALQLLSIHTDIEKLGSADLIVEAVPEHEALKFSIFRKLDEICGPSTILASNTSSISITRIGAATKRPDRVIGMHFMNPVPIMQLVEIIRGHQTGQETVDRVLNVASSFGKTTVVAQDYPGFLVNRILMPMINEAIFALYEGVGDAEAIDLAMKLGTNQPMGPLQLADFIGLDTCLAILTVLHEGLGDPKYRPCPLLKRYVDAGLVGKKGGQGFFRY